MLNVVNLAFFIVFLAKKLNFFFTKPFEKVIIHLKIL